jgi:hypothetical protein
MEEAAAWPIGVVAEPDAEEEAGAAPPTDSELAGRAAARRVNPARRPGAAPAAPATTEIKAASAGLGPAEAEVEPEATTLQAAAEAEAAAAEERTTATRAEMAPARTVAKEVPASTDSIRSMAGTADMADPKSMETSPRTRVLNGEAAEAEAEARRPAAPGAEEEAAARAEDESSFGPTRA